MGKHSKKGLSRVNHNHHVHHKAGEGTHHHHHLHEGPLYNKYHHHSQQQQHGSDHHEEHDANQTATGGEAPATDSSLSGSEGVAEDSVTSGVEEDVGMDEPEDRDLPMLAQQQQRYVPLAISEEDGGGRSTTNVSWQQFWSNEWSKWVVGHDDDVPWIVSLTVALELITCLLRFGFGWQATRDTASTLGKLTLGLRIHHGYLGVLLLVLWRWWQPFPPPRVVAWVRHVYAGDQWMSGLFRLGWALVASDLIHHFLVLWPVTGSPQFDFFYPS